MDPNENLAKVRKLVHELDRLDYERWLQIGVFTFRWWLLVVFLIAPWIVWAKLRDRGRTLEILFLGTVVMLVTVLLDILGYNIDFWDYPVEFLPAGVPGALPFDLSMVPVPFMLLYQYFRSWKSYLMALLAMAVLYAFIGEPLANTLDLVTYIKWSNLYSFIYYLLVGTAVRALVEKLARLYLRSAAA